MTVQSYQPRINLTPFETAPKQKRLLGILLALAVLGAVVLVLLYSGWFRNIVRGASNEVGVSTSETTAEKPGHGSSARSRRTSSKQRADAIVPPASEAQLAFAPGVTEAAIRSPLAVEVISGGGRRQIIGTRDDSIYLDLRDKSVAAPDVVNANAGVVELSSLPAGVADPLLAKQQTMEGAVVLLARIDKDGNIQNLQAISGPEILFAAAREAVKQWRFKPYYESGQAVETEAQITVKFAISAH